MGINFEIRLFIISLVQLLNLIPRVQPMDISLIQGEVNQEYNLSAVNDNHTAVRYLISKNETNFQTAEFRLEVEVTDRFISDFCPLVITLSQGKQVASWYLPQNAGLIDETPKYLYIIGKTICIDPKPIPINGVQIQAVASTCGIVPIQFKMKLAFIPNALSLAIGQDRVAWIAPTTSKFYKYEFPDDPDVQTIIVKLQSPINICMTLSIQRPSCPVFDAESTVRHSVLWQTFTTRSGITIERKDYPKGFFLVLVVNNDDSGCVNKDGYNNDETHESQGFNRKNKISRPDAILQEMSQELGTLISAQDVGLRNLYREKQVELTVKKSLRTSQYVWPTFFPIVIYFPVILLTLIMFIWFQRQCEKNYTTSNEKPDTRSFLRSEKYISDSLEEVDGFQRESLEKKSQRYLWLLITVAIFYCIPVFQLILNYLSIVYRTGEQDICYYNNLCSLPLYSVMDFNHIYSNVGYVIFGSTFMIFTYLRKQTMVGRRGYFVFESKTQCCSLMRVLPRRLEFGTLDQYGLFYSLGFALLMEGFLSASYHICPNKANFQFDTSFMYAMAVLSYVKVYQFRHFMYMNELMAFLLLALVVGCVVLGLFSANLAFNILLSFIHLLLVVTFQLFLLFISRSTKDEDDETGFFEIIWGISLEICGLVDDKKSRFLIKHHPNKSLFWWTVSFNVLLVINSWTLVYGTNFATQVLYILLANLALYVIYYLIMKGIHGEFRGILSEGIRNPSLQPIIYGIISGCFWIIGLYYFMNPESTWDVSPAKSRQINNSCALLQFYDNHDIWHMISSPALFFSFMMFLTIDDGIIGRNHQSIPVF